METSETSPEPLESDALPLDELKFTPDWVQARRPSYAGHPGGGDEDERGSGRGRRDDNRAPSRGFGDRRPGGRSAGKSGGASPPRKDRRAGPASSSRPGTRPEDRRGPPRTDRGVQSRSAPAPAPVDVTFLPEEKGFAAMVEVMKQSSRAYTLFDVARLVLNKPERHIVRLSRSVPPQVKPDRQGPVPKTGQNAGQGDPKSASRVASQGMRQRELFYLVTGSENPFLSQQEAERFLFCQQANQIFKEAKTSIDPPKGIFTYVNRCGFTGEMLGPPNYHGYMDRLRLLHRTRLSHIPFDEFKLKIRTEKDPAAVQAWMESLSTKTEFTCLLDAEPKVFLTRAEVEKHVVENHLAQLIKTVPEVRIPGPASRQLANDDILEAVREAWLTERRFPLKTANEIRWRLNQRGFHLFKHKGIAYVTWILFKRFESALGLTARIQKLMLFLRNHEGIHRKQLIEHLVPPSTPMAEAAANLPAAAAPETPPLPEPLPLTAEQQAERSLLLADLAWLIRDGYVVEFSDGALWGLADEAPKPVASKIQTKPETEVVSTTGVTPTTVDLPAPEKLAEVTEPLSAESSGETVS